jgi:hypothetical protein
LKKWLKKSRLALLQSLGRYEITKYPLFLYPFDLLLLQLPFPRKPMRRKGGVGQESEKPKRFAMAPIRTLTGIPVTAFHQTRVKEETLMSLSVLAP